MAKSGPFVLKCRTPGVPLDASNLVWRAASSLWTALGRQGELADMTITLRKDVPLGAGLGGGSADAAAALHALARAWGGAPIALLRDVAGGIGADVPYFLKQLGRYPLSDRDEGYPWAQLYNDEGRPSGEWGLDGTSAKGGDPIEWPADLRVREYPA